MKPTYELFIKWKTQDLQEHLAFLMTQERVTIKGEAERQLSIQLILQHLNERGAVQLPTNS